MYTYTHLVVASLVESVFQPGDPQAYYLGAVVPDFRYLAGMRRDQTHLPLREIAGWFDRFPHLESFVLGYLVHCALDELEVRPLVFRKLPLGPVSRAMRLKLAHTLLETYYIEHASLTIRISEEGNEILESLGIGEALVKEFASWGNRFLCAPSFEDEIEFLKESLLTSGNPRFRHLLGPLRTLQRSRTLKNLLIRSFDPPYFEAVMVRYLLGAEVGGRWKLKR